MEKKKYYQPILGKTIKFTILCTNTQFASENITRSINSVEKQKYKEWEGILLFPSMWKKNEKDKFEEICLNLSSKWGFEHFNKYSDINEFIIKTIKNEWILFIRPEVILSRNLLDEYITVFNRHPDIKVIYSDSTISKMKDFFKMPVFKPDFSFEYLFSTNYIGKVLLLHNSVLEQIADKIDLSSSTLINDILLFLASSINTNDIFHIKKILFHEIINNYPNTTQVSISHLENDNPSKKFPYNFYQNLPEGTIEQGLLPGTIRYKRSILDNPLVSIIIPTRNQVSLLSKCIESILNKSSYENYEIIVIDNESTDNDTLEYLKNSGLNVVSYNKPFNFSAINNLGVQCSKGEYIIFLNNDTEVITPEWIESLLEYTQEKEIGAVGCKLLFTDGKIQHAGVVIGLGGIAGHSFSGYSKKDSGYCGLIDIPRNVSAVTAAALMVRREYFLNVGGFDEKLPVSFNDVDLCLKLRKYGLRNVYTPYAVLFHHESASRKKSVNDWEITYMNEKWGDVLKSDPNYNPNLSRLNPNWEIKFVA